MSTKALIVGVLLCIQASVLADALHLDFPTEGARVIFTSAELPKALPEGGDVVREKSFELDLSKAKPTDFVVVWDRDANNVAVSKIAPLKGNWHLQQSDFTLIGNVAIKLESQGKPVASADVQLRDSKGTRSQLVDPTSKGAVRFFGIAPGSVQVTTRFKAGSAEADPLVQVFQLSLTRKTTEPELIVALPAGVATNQPDSKPVEATPTTGSAADSGKGASANQSPTKEEKTSPLASGFIMLVALGLIGGALFALYHKAKSTPDLADHLRKIGVPVAPEPPTAGDLTSAAADAAYTPPAPTPPAKIMLPDSEPVVLPSAPVATMAAPAASNGRLKLRAESGGTFDLAEGETIAGRDDSVPLSFAGESSVSRHHAVFQSANNILTVRDSGSTNGTFVNGQRISAETTLKLGDVVQLGAVRLYVEG